MFLAAVLSMFAKYGSLFAHDPYMVGSNKTRKATWGVSNRLYSSTTISGTWVESGDSQTIYENIKPPIVDIINDKNAVLCCATQSYNKYV